MQSLNVIQMTQAHNASVLIPMDTSIPLSDEAPQTHAARTAQFEARRAQLTRMAQHLLGSTLEADDAVQEAWLRFSRTEPAHILNSAAWLNTVVTRICLDLLRARKRTGETEIDADQDLESELEIESAVDALSGRWASDSTAADPLDQLVLAESLGMALQVVVQHLAPAERIAFVLHDVFDLPFEAVGPIIGRSSTAARQLASRGRRRIHRAPSVSDDALSAQRNVVDAFLDASRKGDFEALLSLLDADVELHTAAAGVPVRTQGADMIARRALQGAGESHAAVPILVDGQAGLAVLHEGRLRSVFVFQISRGRIQRIDIVADPARLGSLQLSLLPR